MSSPANSRSAPKHYVSGVAAATTFTCQTNGRNATQTLAAQLARCLPPGFVIALYGDLGAGKTTFVQGLAAGLGFADRVTSPTFVLINEYRLADGRRLAHLDAYRLTADAPVQEAATLGLEEILDDPQTIVAIEWADRVASLLPADLLQVRLVAEADAGATQDPVNERRTVTFVATGPGSAGILACVHAALVTSKLAANTRSAA